MRAEMAKLLMVMGGIMFAIGLIVLLAPRIPWIGRLPGDIDIQGKGFRISFPIITCILLSILLTILLNLLSYFRK
jgi:ribose/xylose/arabinose/galactoside ABC-type transport system permease subunit